MTDTMPPAANDPDLGKEEVAAYLRHHPDFLAENPDLLKDLTAPGRWSGDGVVDIQQYMLEQLRGETDNLRDAARHVIETSRSNMAVQTRVHTAVLVLLNAGDFDQLAHIIHHDLPLPLDVDTAVIAFEDPGRPMPQLVAENVRLLAPGVIDSLVGSERDAALCSPFYDGDRAVFAEAAGLVRSAALARLRPSADLPQGLLALGARGTETFHPNQGTELLVFLARVVERLAHRFLGAVE